MSFKLIAFIFLIAHWLTFVLCDNLKHGIMMLLWWSCLLADYFDKRLDKMEKK